MNTININIYTDGSCLGNPGNGGCAFIMHIDDLVHRYACGHFNTTNNRMELSAVIAAFVAIAEMEFDSKIKYQINIYSDSKYVTDAINKGWLFNWVRKNFRNVKNSDLWSEVFIRVAPLMLMSNVSVVFNWVKGHNGNTMNEAVDLMAKQACNNNGIVTNCIYSNIKQTNGKIRGIRSNNKFREDCL